MSPDGLTIVTFRYKEKHHEEMQAAWDLLDSDNDGFITATELQDMLLRIGRRLAPWELREMMEAAPGCTVMLYSAHWRQTEANLYIVGDKGKICSEIPKMGGGNGNWHIYRAQRLPSLYP